MCPIYVQHLVYLFAIDVSVKSTEISQRDYHPLFQTQYQYVLYVHMWLCNVSSLRKYMQVCFLLLAQRVSEWWMLYGTSYMCHV
jgi:hypothetical protein